MNINGITRILTSDMEGYFYTTDKLLSDNILIEESNRYKDNGDIDTWLTLYYYNHEDAMMFTLGIQDNFTPLVVYGMIKEIVALHDSNSLSDFIEIIKELSVSSMTALSQSKEDNKKNVRFLVVQYFDEYYKLVSKD